MIRGVASGLMAVNLVDEVTQFQFIGSVERIAERFLLPVLEALIQLDDIAQAMSDNETAQRLNQARAELFRSINNAQNPAA